MSGKVKCTCGWSWNKSDSSKKDMYICHECGRDNSNNMKNGGWLDNYGKEDNYNDSQVSAPEGFQGDGYSNVGRDSSPAWGGQFQMGGSVYPVNYVPEAQTGGSFPGATGFSYARTGSIPSEGKYAKKTMASAQSGDKLNPFSYPQPDHYSKMNPFFVADPQHKIFVGGVNPTYSTKDFSVGASLVGVGNQDFMKIPADYGVRGSYNPTDSLSINANLSKNNVGAGISYRFENGGNIAQNGQEMQYYREGLDFKPKTISKNGGWLDSYDKAQNGKTVKYGTPEYEEAYNKGEIVTKEGVRSPILLDEVVIQGKPLTEFGKTRKEITKNNTWEKFANERFLGNFEKNMGQTLENLPDYRKQEYEDYVNKLAFNEYVKTHPQAKDEKRGSYIDRIQSQNSNSSNFNRAYEANAEYNPSTDVNLWRKGLMGMGSFVLGPENINKLKQSSDYFSSKEKLELLENPYSSAIETTLGTLAPLEIPANMMYGRNNTWDEALSGRPSDVPIEARLLGDPAMLAFEAVPLLSKGYSAIKNSELASNIMNKGKNVLSTSKEAGKEIGKDVYGLLSRERSTKLKELNKEREELDALYRSDEYADIGTQEYGLRTKEWKLQQKIADFKNNANVAERLEIDNKLNKARGREDIAKLFTVNNEGLVQSGKDTSLGLRTGSTDIVDLETGATHSISTNVPNDNVRFDLEGNKVVKTIGNSQEVSVSPGYTSTVKKNIDFIENKIPGAKVFGSARNVADAELPHLIGDYDVIMSQSEYNKFTKANPPVGNNGFAQLHDIPDAAKGMDPIDINVIEEANGKATGQRAKELFRQVAPDEFYKAAKESIKSNSEIKIPYSSQELVDMTNPSSKSVVDAYESTKQKHLNKIDALINYGKPSVVKAGQEQYIKSLVGSKGTLGHQFPLEQLSDVDSNTKILDEIGFIGNKKLAASNPERMQLALNDYYINNSVLVRQVDTSKNIDKVEAAIKEYKPDAGGGAVFGIGQNHVTLGFPHHGWNNVTSVKQLGLNFDKTDPLSYIASIKHQTSGEQLFNESEQKILSDIVDSLRDSSVKGEGINLVKGTGSAKDIIKQSKNTSELIRHLPYSEEGKTALYDFAKQTGRHLAKSEAQYGSSNFSVTLRDFDDAIDAMQYTTLDQVQMDKTLKSYMARKEAASSNDSTSKIIEELLPKQFKGIKGYLEGGQDRARKRMDMLIDERTKIESDISNISEKVYGKKYKEEIERVKQYRQQIDDRVAEHDKMLHEIKTRIVKLKKVEQSFKNILIGSAGVGTLAGIYGLHKYEQSPEQQERRMKSWERLEKQQEQRRKQLDKMSPAERKKAEAADYDKQTPMIGKAFDWMMGVKHENGGIINSDRGQWDHPGKITRIKGGNITMKPDPKTGKKLTQPLLGIANTGEKKMMYPGQDYQFQEGTEYVTEIPKGKIAKNGLRQEQKSLQNLDNLTNFTNYNKPQPGGWLNKYN